MRGIDGGMVKAGVYLIAYPIQGVHFRTSFPSAGSAFYRRCCARMHSLSRPRDVICKTGWMCLLASLAVAFQLPTVMPPSPMLRTATNVALPPGRCSARNCRHASSLQIPSPLLRPRPSPFLSTRVGGQKHSRDMETATTRFGSTLTFGWAGASFKSHPPRSHLHECRLTQCWSIGRAERTSSLRDCAVLTGLAWIYRTAHISGGIIVCEDNLQHRNCYDRPTCVNSAGILSFGSCRQTSECNCGVAVRLCALSQESCRRSPGLEEAMGA
ncbi:hypothetical protein C8T65DRAFT_131112 [Cerioporus squamosus]|nr:hypothetical protein C8T65DRAFT_131112 [Cerioporus squamosus]